MKTDPKSVPERLTAAAVLRRLGGVTRTTLTRWMHEDEAAKLGFTHKFPSGVGTVGLAKTWDSGEVEKWISENGAKTKVAILDAGRNVAVLPLSNALQAVAKATDGTTTSQELCHKIERLLRTGLRSDPKLRDTLKGIKIKGDEIEFEFNGNDQTSFVYFLLTYG
jgi:predicted DNA-binding transcriptional regulator AlpA